MSRQLIPGVDAIIASTNQIRKASHVIQSNFANGYTRMLQDDTMRMLESALPPPDTRFTWAQSPVYLEDALGRSILIPSEYSYDVRLKYRFVQVNLMCY